VRSRYGRAPGQALGDDLGRAEQVRPGGRWPRRHRREAHPLASGRIVRGVPPGPADPFAVEHEEEHGGDEQDDFVERSGNGEEPDDDEPAERSRDRAVASKLPDGPEGVMDERFHRRRV